MSVDANLRRLVRERAENRCEYCGCHQDELPFVTFHVEHIIARQHGGADDESNLCLACHWCNFHKGPNLSTIVDGELVPLFHPRLQRWDDHFANLEDMIYRHDCDWTRYGRVIQYERRRPLRTSPASAPSVMTSCYEMIDSNAPLFTAIYSRYDCRINSR